LWRIIFQANKSLSSQLCLKRIEHISQQLSEFYNPIYSMMLANRHIFQHFGPKSFPDDEIYRQTAGENWKLLKEKVILPNNRLMAEILREKSHLISLDDDISHYLDLNNHLSMYEIFSENPTELYQDYQFPIGILGHVESKRKKLVQSLNELKDKN
ncbi:hypothetical protein, partial [Candidatus Oleimmundimicrobium sp.]|uniref:hypothetical protein n=1 Tax=Candidatus Oleimmundimicrobium sp. TaxID=3060597 RepID=UPI002724FAFC